MSESWIDPKGAGRVAVLGQGAYSSQTVLKLREDDVDTSLLFLAWELARWTRLPPKQRAAFRLWVLQLLIVQSEGSTSLPDPVALSNLEESLYEHGIVEEMQTVMEMAQQHASELSFVLADGNAPLVYHNSELQAQKHHVAEGRVADAIWALKERALPVRSFSLLPNNFSDEQLAAVEHMAHKSLSILTGGPGTGKSTVIVAMVEALLSLGVSAEEIVLCAPTGKAADRLTSALRSSYLAADVTEAIRVSTLHRVLSYSPTRRRFLRDESDPVDARAVVVDECSMIDLQLFDQLMRAIPPECRLVLVGDPDQLPPVGVGAVFQDLCTHKGLDDSRIALTKSFRMTAEGGGADVLRLAQAIASGGSIEEQLSVSSSVRLVSSERVHRQAFFEKWFDERFTRRGLKANTVLRSNSESVLEESALLIELMEEMRKSQILCFTRVGPLGSVRINEWFAARLRQNGKRYYALGEPMIVTRNDYSRGLFNGDIGLVLSVCQKGQAPSRCLVVSGDTGWVAHPMNVLHDLVEPAYAITVHKAQGSEYEHVALMVSEGANASKEILYTGVTRAKRTVTLVGTMESVKLSATTTKKRHTGLPKALTLR